MSEEIGVVIGTLVLVVAFIWFAVDAVKCVFWFAAWPFRAVFGIVRNVIELRRLRRGELPTGSLLPVVKRSAKPKEKC